MSPEAILWIGVGTVVGLLMGVRWSRAKRAIADMKGAKTTYEKSVLTMRAAIKVAIVGGLFFAVFFIATTARMWAGRH